MGEATALAIVLLVATATVSSAHGARTLETAERRVAIPAPFVASPPAAEGVVDFDVLLEDAAADGPAAAAGPDADWDDKAPAASGP